MSQEGYFMDEYTVKSEFFNFFFVSSAAMLYLDILYSEFHRICNGECTQSLLVHTKAFWSAMEKYRKGDKNSD